jgi:transcriptional regulator with XRE-family HTH domain
MNMQRFGQQLKTFRQQRQLTQRELAQRSGVPQPLISDLEAGKREGVTLEMAWRLARELSVSLDHLAGTWDQAEESARAAAEQKTRRGRPRRAAPAAPASACG